MFIVFEGGEGVGKSTQIELVYKALLDKKLPCVKTREPGGTPLAEKIRFLFKEKTNEAPTTLAELYLVCAARAQHVEKLIKPNLAHNKIILCDRFLDSTYVYQYLLGKLSKQVIDSATAPILQGLLPTLTFVFHCDKNFTLTRIKQEENRHTDRLDSYSTEIHDTILQGYKKVFSENFTYPCGTIPKRILINAEENMEKVFYQIKQSLNKYLSINL